MRRWIGAALVAAGLLMAAPAAITAAAAGAGVTAVHVADANTTDFSARRHYRHYRHYAYRPYYRPYYYARPTYYRPYPYASPAPFFLGFGFSPWGW